MTILFQVDDPYAVWTVWKLTGDSWVPTSTFTDVTEMIAFAEKAEESNIIRVTEERREAVEVFWPALQENYGGASSAECPYCHHVFYALKDCDALKEHVEWCPRKS